MGLPSSRQSFPTSRQSRGGEGRIPGGRGTGVDGGGTGMQRGCLLNRIKKYIMSGSRRRATRDLVLTPSFVLNFQLLSSTRLDEGLEGCPRLGWCKGKERVEVSKTSAARGLARSRSCCNSYNLRLFITRLPHSFPSTSRPRTSFILARRFSRSQTGTPSFYCRVSPLGLGSRG